MKCLIISIVGVLFIRWNFSVIVESPPAIFNLLLAVASGFALGVYVFCCVFDALTAPQARNYTWNR